MQDVADKPTAGFDGYEHFRAPGDPMPAIHGHAKRKVMTLATELPTVSVEAVERRGIPLIGYEEAGSKLMAALKTGYLLA